MLLFVTILFVVIYSFDILFLFLFGVHTYLMIYLYKQNHEYCNTNPEEDLKLSDKNLPKVTVQLPIYNEYYVVDRLVDAAVAMKYPKNKLHIQVLDDSTDETVDKAALLVAKYKKQGFNIDHVHRTNRVGHKAGALDEGMNKTDGEFIAIFDADFIPDPDFLLKTIAYFKDPVIGMVQARWGHINRDYNMLTKAQSYGIDGHFMIEQVARNATHLWMNFNGTAGIWRRDCIVDAGGWEHDTLTEDFDLSYRAELKGWKFRYFKDIECKAEIPAMVSAYKSQQFRWCKGSIQTAVKLLPRILKSNFPLKIKLEATTHLINYSVHPLMVINILFTAPLLLMPYWAHVSILDLPIEILMVSAVFLSIGSLGPLIFYAYSQKVLHKDWWKRLAFLPVMTVIGTGIAIVNTRAWIEAVLGVQSSFKRTPKLAIENSSDDLKSRLKYKIPLDYHAVLEILMGAYCIFTIYLAVFMGKLFVIPFLVLYSAGFFFVGFQTLKEAVWGMKGAKKVSVVPEKITL